MTNIISRCNICGEFFQSKKGVKEHKDRNHRITNSKIVQLKGLILGITTMNGCWLSKVILSFESPALSAM